MSAMNMCIGEKKKTFIPHKFGFGAVHVKNIFKYLSLNSKIKRSDKEPSKYYISFEVGWARKGVIFTDLHYHSVSAFKEFQKLIILWGNSNISPF